MVNKKLRRFREKVFSGDFSILKKPKLNRNLEKMKQELQGLLKNHTHLENSEYTVYNTYFGNAEIDNQEKKVSLENVLNRVTDKLFKLTKNMLTKPKQPQQDLLRSKISSFKEEFQPSSPRSSQNLRKITSNSQLSEAAGQTRTTGMLGEKKNIMPTDSVIIKARKFDEEHQKIKNTPRETDLKKFYLSEKVDDDLEEINEQEKDKGENEKEDNSIKSNEKEENKEDQLEESEEVDEYIERVGGGEPVGVGFGKMMGVKFGKKKVDFEEMEKDMREKENMQIEEQTNIQKENQNVENESSIQSESKSQKEIQEPEDVIEKKEEIKTESVKEEDSIKEEDPTPQNMKEKPEIQETNTPEESPDQEKEESTEKKENNKEEDEQESKSEIKEETKPEPSNPEKPPVIEIIKEVDSEEQKDFNTFASDNTPIETQPENHEDLEDALIKIERKTEGKRNTMMGLMGLVDEDLDRSEHLPQSQSPKNIESGVLFESEKRDIKVVRESKEPKEDFESKDKLETLLVSDVIPENQNSENKSQEESISDQNQEKTVQVKEEKIDSEIKNEIEVNSDVENKEERESTIKENKEEIENDIQKSGDISQEKDLSKEEKLSDKSDSEKSDRDNSDISGVSGIKISNVKDNLKNVESEEREDDSNIMEEDEFTKFNSLVGRDGEIIDLNRMDSLKVSQEDHDKVYFLF